MIRYAFSGDEIVPQGATPTALDDGDFWGGATLCGVAVALAAAVVPVRPAFAADDDFIAPAAPSTIVDEDYATVAVPQPAPWLRLYLPDPEELPAGALFGQPDEDFWQNPVKPVPATLYQRLPLGDPEELPAATLFGTPDEDFWRPPIPAPSPPLVQPFLDDDVFVQAPAPATIVDEDFWLPSVPSPQTRPPVAFSDTDDLPVTVAAPTVVDEDFWLPPVSLPPRAPPLVFVDTDDPAGSLFGQPDEDFYLPPAPSAPWRCAPFLDTDEIVPQPVPGQPDEDYWTLGPPPVPAAMYLRLPYLPDPEEIPAGNLTAPAPRAVVYAIFVFDD
jgi:hypothetical protein